MLVLRVFLFFGLVSTQLFPMLHHFDQQRVKIQAVLREWNTLNTVQCYCVN